MPRRVRVNPAVALGVLSKSWHHPANKGARMGAVSRSLAYQMRGRLLGRGTIVPFGLSSRVMASYDDVGSRRAAYSPLPDFLEMSAWLKCLQPGDRFVDVGANVGLYTVLAAECGADVIAIEPQPQARRQLEANLALNGYEAEIHGVAVGAEPGLMSLDGVDSQRMHLTGAVSDTSTEVVVRTLDELLGGRTVHGLKIDVEGAERLALDGAQAALSEQRLRLIQLEWNDTSLQNFGETRGPLADILRQAGYELLRPTAGGGMRPIDDLSPGPDVFARPIV